MTHYFSEKQDSEFKPYKIEVVVAGFRFDMYSAAGVFSKDELDYGSRLLIELSEVKNGSFVLDLGCGIGVVGISIAKKFKDITLTMADVNERAVDLAKMNSRLNHIKADCVKTNIYDGLDGKKFEVILLNPPQTAGKEVCIAMIEQAKDHLNAGGSLQIVARKNKGGSTLAKVMEETFGNVSILGRKGMFYVWKSTLIE